MLSFSKSVYLTILFSLLPCCSVMTSMLLAQPTGYYNGTEGLTGESLKTALHEIIDDHYFNTNWYSNAKYTFLESDADPAISGNIIDVYSGNSMNGLNYGTQEGTLNREHVWAKSHGAFPENSPMYSDHHNLKPCESRINQDRSNLDFDWSSIPHPTATGSKYDSDSWEPRDAVKGDIARIIFYMATRYEGTNGELDLEVADWVGTYPMPKHGKLSTLFEWNISDPPDDFERNRNNVIYSEQGNRNPYIDNPDWISMIWGSLSAPIISIGDFEQNPQVPTTEDYVEISCSIEGVSGNAEVKILWGNTFSELNQQATMTKTNNRWQGFIPPQTDNLIVFYRVQVTDNGEIAQSVCYNYTFSDIISIADIQGNGSTSPYVGEIVQTTGVVTAVLSNGYYIQDGENERSGIFVYDNNNDPVVNNSILISGSVSEYHNLTELSNISNFSLQQSFAPLPSPVMIHADDVNEDLESMRVSIQGTCKEISGNGYWLLEDETGTLFIHNNDYFFINPTVGNTYSLTGIISVYDSRWFLELYNTSLNINENTAAIESVIIFPNPAANQIQISIPKELASPEKLDFFDANGKLFTTIFCQENSDNYTIDISSFPSGLWMICFYNKNYQFIKKFVKIR